MAEKVEYKVLDDLKMTAKLFSGREVVVDISKITTAEWKSITRPGLTDEQEYELLEKVTGIPAEELGKMLQPDYRALIDLFLKAGTQPLTNPT